MSMMSDMAVYLSLFLTALAAATVLPMQSEAVLTGLLLTKNYEPYVLVVVASLGNVLGSVVNWFIGRGIEKFHDRKWFPVKSHTLDRAKNWYHRFGRWSLLLSWMPFIGDPITVAAGVMRERLSVFVAIVALAKTGRYLILAMLVL